MAVGGGDSHAKHGLFRRRSVVTKKAEKVIVAMSGGVDSSVAALLLKQRGYQVIGVTMQIWPQPEDKAKACCSLDAVNDARRVAWHLGFPHFVMNFRDEFEEKVIKYFCLEYIKGRTPNPCIACNRYIKFESLLRKARGIGAEFIATGHYARVLWDDKEVNFQLLTGVDPTKDQSYALYSMTQEQLAHTIFPLGNLRKEEVRAIAREAGLPVSDKPDSQEICFVSDDNYAGFVEEYLEVKPEQGEIKSISGKPLGKHQGIHRYTIGQRKGLGLALGYPVYVTKVDPKEQTVWVGEDKDLFSEGLTASDFNYISGVPFEGAVKVQVKIRYNSPRVEAVAEPWGDGIKVTFLEPQRAVAPGQAVVLYDGERVLGGGIID